MYFFPLYFQAENGYNESQINLIGFFPRNSSGFSPEKHPKAPGRLFFMH